MKVKKCRIILCFVMVFALNVFGAHMHSADAYVAVEEADFLWEKNEDGTVCGGAFKAPARAITIRNAEKKQMSEAQMGNLAADEDEDEV